MGHNYGIQLIGKGVSVTTCVPIKELKNTAEFSRLVEESESPVFVTKNGYESFVAMTTQAYEALKLEAARAKLYQSIDRAEQDIVAGRTIEAHTAIANLRARYGL